MHADKGAKKITGTGGKDKTPVMGISERGSKVGPGSKVRVNYIITLFEYVTSPLNHGL